MKLFYFNPNGYGEQAFVAAETREEAIKALLATKPEKLPWGTDDDQNRHNEYYQDKINKMVNCLPHYKGSKDRYTIDEFPAGSVIFSEIA